MKYLSPAHLINQKLVVERYICCRGGRSMSSNTILHELITNEVKSVTGERERESEKAEKS